jgi:PAS domain S-box-containing protein
LERRDATFDPATLSVAGQFGVLMEALPDGVLIADSSGRIAFVNSRLEDLSGYRRVDLLGRPVEMLVPDRIQPVHEGHRSGYGEGPRLRPMGTGLDIRLRRQDGTEVPVDIQLSPISVAGEALTLAAIRDIEQRKNAEEAIRAGEERLAVALDRERIARVLVDNVIGSLFGIGLALQGMSARTRDDEARRRLDDLVAEADSIIAELRNQVFGLRG